MPRKGRSHGTQLNPPMALDKDGMKNPNTKHSFIKAKQTKQKYSIK